jgi:nucleotide-binding universal stress UspA family protein
MKDANRLHGPVMAAIDLTETADEVLRQAVAIAKALKTSVSVCHVMHEAAYARMLFPQLAAVDRQAGAQLEQRVRDAIAARVAAVAPGSHATIRVSVEGGSPHAGLLREIERSGAGLAVLGPGHVAERVARYAPCAILVARPSTSGSVVGATDFSDPSLPAIAIAAAEAARRGRPLRVLHCVEFSEPVLLGSSTVAIGVLPAFPGELVETLEREARDRLQDALRRANAKGDGIVARGTPAQAILEAANATPTELIVIGTRGRSDLGRLLLGSVAETVLRNAPCSVLVVHVQR